MANICNFTMRIYGKSDESVERFIDAMNYSDLKDGYFMARVFDTRVKDRLVSERGIKTVTVEGICAWSVHSSMNDKTYGSLRGLKYGEPIFHVWRDEGKIRYSNIPVTLQELCGILGCGVEIWSEENMIGLEEHYIISSSGKMTTEESILVKEGEEDSHTSGRLKNWGKWESGEVVMDEPFS